MLPPPPPVFNYRDYVPPFIVTDELRRPDDLSQMDSSRPAQIEEHDSAAAQAVLDGLKRMVADFRAKPVAQEVLDSAKAGLKADLETSREHERAFREQARWAKEKRAAMKAQRPTRNQRAERRKILAKLDVILSAAERELRQSERMSAAYLATLKELDATTPKILTRVELKQIEWLEQRQAELRAAQEKIAQHPESANEVTRELSEHLKANPLPVETTQAKQEIPRQQESKLPTLGLAAQFMGPVLGGLAMGGILTDSPIGMFVGAAIGALSVVTLRRENINGGAGSWR
jgi:hypothetical protein